MTFAFLALDDVQCLPHLLTHSVSMLKLWEW